MKYEITIYTTTTCPVCQLVREFLINLNLDYKEVNVDFNPIAMIKLIGKTGKFKVPQITINGQWIYGFNPSKMLTALKQ